MKNNSLKLKSLRNAMLFVLLNLSFSIFAADSYGVEFNGNTNAVSSVPSFTITGTTIYKTFTITVPFYSNKLDELTFRSDYSVEPCLGQTVIKVNNIFSSYLSHPNPAMHKWHRIADLPLGTSYYTVLSLCNNSEIPGTQQVIKIIIKKEADPLLNLTISTSCEKNKQNKYNGNLNFLVSGTYANAGKIFIKGGNILNTCDSGAPYKLTYLAPSDYNNPNNTISNAPLFTCYPNTTYTVDLYYKSDAANGGTILKKIEVGDYGWAGYTFKKTRQTCQNIGDIILVPFTPFQDFSLEDQSGLTITNPVKEEVSLILSSDKNANYEVQIYDFSGLPVKRASFKDISSKTTNTINVQDLKKGIYLMEIRNGDSVIREKLIKE